MMSNDVSFAPGMKEISSLRFAALYNWMMDRPLVRHWFDPLRREIVGQARGVVLEVGAGGGQNFPFYDPTSVVRVEAVEPDEAMLVEARRRLTAAPVPITLTRAAVEALPFPDAHFESAVVTLVFCSVRDPECGLREIWRVLKPGGILLLLEHVRAGKGGRVDPGCARAALDPLHGQLPLEPRYLAHSAANRFPGRAGSKEKRRTPAHAEPFSEPFPNARGVR
jgi:SAM-dependent methyltransferase